MSIKQSGNSLVFYLHKNHNQNVQNHPINIHVKFELNQVFSVQHLFLIDLFLKLSYVLCLFNFSSTNIEDL